MGQVTASVTIGFATANKNFNTSFSAEVDAREDGLNGGVTNFPPGANIYILLYQGEKVTLTDSIASDGQLAQSSPIAVEQTEQIVVAYADTFNVSRPIAAGTTPVFTWYGDNPGAMTKISETEYSFTEKKIAVGSVTYISNAKVYMLSGVNITYPAAVVVFIGTTPA